MKAIVYSKYGPPDVLKVKEIPIPSAGPNDFLVKITATTVTAEDPKQRAFKWPPLLRIPVGIMFGFRKPKLSVLGIELSGVVESVGKNVKRFSVGDEVFGYTGLTFGAYAEYKSLPETALVTSKPYNLSFEEAAAVPNGALSALVFLKKKGKLRKGEKILIYGSSGAVGSAAVQLAKVIGAEVTAVCSRRNMSLVQDLGADYVIDYLEEDFTANEIRYDVIFDTIGKTQFSACQKSLSDNGRYLVTEFGVKELMQVLTTYMFGHQRVMVAAANLHWQQTDLEYIRDLCERGQFKPVIDRCFPLEEAAKAHSYVEQGHKVGNVVLKV